MFPSMGLKTLIDWGVDLLWTSFTNLLLQVAWKMGTCDTKRSDTALEGTGEPELSTHLHLIGS